MTVLKHLINYHDWFSWEDWHDDVMKGINHHKIQCHVITNNGHAI